MKSFLFKACLGCFVSVQGYTVVSVQGYTVERLHFQGFIK